MTESNIVRKELYKNNSNKSIKKNDYNSELNDEVGGFKGKNPTEYGDWQHNGRVTDF